MYKVALIDDDVHILEFLRDNLAARGFEVDCFHTAEQFLDVLGVNAYDLVLLDIILPGINGEEAIQLIRDKGIRTPVLILTSMNDIDMKVKLLGIGADDYLSKPFSVHELEARIKAIVRRSRSGVVIPADKIITIGTFTVNLETRHALTNSGEIILTDKETSLLKFLYRNAGRPINRTEILEEVWGMDVFPSPRTVDNFLVKFRKLFELDPDNPKHFITVRSIGYRFEN
jgi:two-component system, OmpR family, alkaline phosphatase synthesis response regulator PhoP